MHKVALALAAAIFFGVILSMRDRQPAPPPIPQAVTSDPETGVTAAIEPIPVAILIERVEVRVMTNVKLLTEYGTIGVRISPRRIRWLYLKLGASTRAYEVNGRIKLFIPNSLNGNSTFEWGDDYAVVTVDNPSDLRFPDGP